MISVLLGTNKLSKYSFFEEFNRKYKPSKKKKKNFLAKLWSRVILDYLHDEIEDFEVELLNTNESVIIGDSKILLLPLSAFHDSKNSKGFQRLLVQT